MPYMLMKRDGLAGISYYKTGVGPSHRWKKNRAEGTTYNGEDFALRDLANAFTREERQRIEVIELPEEEVELVKYLAFAYMGHDAEGGWNDLLGAFDEIADAIDAVHNFHLIIELASIVQVDAGLTFNEILLGEVKMHSLHWTWTWKEAK